MPLIQIIVLEIMTFLFTNFQDFPILFVPFNKRSPTKSQLVLGWIMVFVLLQQKEVVKSYTYFTI